MPCYRPSNVKVQKKSVVSSRRFYYYQVVPCGHCLGCRSEQARQWAVRLIHEKHVHDYAWFATLTYADSEIPANGSLCPEHFRKFIKSLRRRYEGTRISYYGCGEYGSHTQRPHYHAVLFGVPFLDRDIHPDSSRPNVYVSSTLDECWGRGITEIGTVTMASASYVAGYVRKKVRRQDDPDYYLRVDKDTGELHELEQEFARMSLRPAIGKEWIKKYWRDVYPRDYVVVDGVKSKPPRYYDKWMDKHHPKMMDEVRDKRYEEMVDVEPAKLAAKEKIHSARVGLFNQRSGI